MGESVDKNDAESILRELWKEHTTAVSFDQIGFGVPFQTFYCDTCRTPYPCGIAKKLARWGSLHPEHEFLSLRAPVKGEIIHPTGRSASLDGSAWAIGEANPTTPPVLGDYLHEPDCPGPNAQHIWDGGSVSCPRP